MWYFLAGIIVIMGFNCATGIIMYAYYHDCDPVAANIVTKHDKLMPRFVKDIAGHITGMPGIFISCVFSASLSTVSAALHCISGVIYSDYIVPMKLFKNNDVNANRTMRLTIFALGSFCAFSGVLVEHFKSLFQAINTVAGVTVGAKFGTFTLAMLYPWANQKVFFTFHGISSSEMKRRALKKNTYFEKAKLSKIFVWYLGFFRI